MKICIAFSCSLESLTHTRSNVFTDNLVAFSGRLVFPIFSWRGQGWGLGTSSLVPTTRSPRTLYKNQRYIVCECDSNLPPHRANWNFIVFRLLSVFKYLKGQFTRQIFLQSLFKFTSTFCLCADSLKISWKDYYYNIFKYYILYCFYEFTNLLWKYLLKFSSYNPSLPWLIFSNFYTLLDVGQLRQH